MNSGTGATAGSTFMGACKSAECTRTLTKVSYVMLQGAVRSRGYERDGIRHRITEVRADSIGKLYRADRQTAESIATPTSNAHEQRSSRGHKMAYGAC